MKQWKMSNDTVQKTLKIKAFRCPEFHSMSKQEFWLFSTSVTVPEWCMTALELDEFILRSKAGLECWMWLWPFCNSNNPVLPMPSLCLSSYLQCLLLVLAFQNSHPGFKVTQGGQSLFSWSFACWVLLGWTFMISPFHPHKEKKP